MPRRGCSAARACKIDAGPPRLVEGVGGRTDHARQRLEAVELAERASRQGRLDGGAQGLVIDRARQAAGQAGRELLEGHDLQAVTALARRSEPKLSHRQPAMGDNGVPKRLPIRPSSAASGAPDATVSVL